MIEGIYGPPGGTSRGASYTPFARSAASFDSSVEWNPPADVETDDPHTDAYSVGDGPPAVGPLADNVVGGGDFPVNAEFDPAGSEFDVIPGVFDVDAVIDNGSDYTSGDVPPNIVLGE